MTQQQERWQAVGRAIVARREQYRWQQADLVRASGVNDLTLRCLERGEISVKGPRLATRQKLEDALNWARGSIDRILDGLEPVELDGDVTRRDVELGVTSGSPTPAMSSAVEAVRAELAAVQAELAVLRERVAAVERPPRLGGPSRPPSGLRSVSGSSVPTP